jgi:ABC-2 type transport system ATP-binding protein
MIEVDSLTKHYGPTRSIDGVSFKVEPGEILGFLGPNGAGKSTTMKLLAGLIRPTSGTARIAGHDMQRADDAARRKLGYLPEAAPLYTDMTLADYLVYMGGLKGLPSREARREMERTTGLVNLQNERRRLLGNLSKGTRQRAALAQALLGSPPVLLLDEPTVGLDPSQINDVRQLIRSLAGTSTVLLSTHILPEVEMTCSRIVIIAGGRVAAQGTPEELVNSERHECRIRLRGEREAFNRVVAQAPLPPDHTQGWASGEGTICFHPGTRDDISPAVARAAVQAGMDVLELSVRRARLEDVFLRAIGKEATTR